MEISDSKNNKKLKIIGLILLSGIIIGGLLSVPFLIGTNGNNDTNGTNNDIDKDDSELIATGTLVRIDNNHWGEGNVSLLRINGTYFIRFINVTIADGPGLYVYLSEKSTFSGIQDEPGNYIDFGRLPAQSGTFTTIMNITIEDIKKYGSVLIWCEPFRVVFTYASLEHVK